MKVITAVETYERQPEDICCFLAGGITNCAEWQDEVIKELENIEGLDNLIIFNPRRKNFPIHDPNASNEQITWEFNNLEQMDIFSMYFAYTEKSDQPICFYELGRNLVRMQDRFDDITSRIIISYEDNFKREQDVVIQSQLAGIDSKVIYSKATPAIHAKAIADCYKALISSIDEFNAF